MNEKENELDFETTEDIVDAIDGQTEALQGEDDIVEMSSQTDNYKEEIIKIIKDNFSPSATRKKLEDYHENDIADTLPELLSTERQKLYRILDVEMLSGIFEYAEIEDAGAYVNEMDIRKASAVISGMESDRAVPLLRTLEKSKRALVIDLLDSESRRSVALIASFDEDEIGSRMTTNFITIPRELSVKQAMSELIAQAAKNDNISTIFVTDTDGTFYGAIGLKDLIIARREDALEDLIVTSFPYVYGHEEIDACIEKLKDYSENYIPVLDNSNKLLGVITSQSVVEVVDDELGEDYAKLAGLVAQESIEEPLVKSMKKRLPWLLVLLGLGLVVSSVVGVFEDVVSKLPVIMAFQTLILNMAGNVGTQSLAVTIRALMDESLTFKQKAFLVRKEIRVGLCNGLLIGLISFVMIGLLLFFTESRSIDFAFAVSGCIGLSLVLSMIIAGAVGTLIPIAFKKMKIDPAAASGPLISTVNDLVAVVAYYGLSYVLLINVLSLA